MKEVALSVLVEPLKMLKVSGEVLLIVSVPAPSSRIVVANPPVQPAAVDSGTVTADAPDWKRRMLRRSMSAVELSH